MTLDTQVKQVMLNALYNNATYQSGEKVVILAQTWDDHLPEPTRERFDKSVALCEALTEVYQEAGIDATLLTYSPSKADSSIEPDDDFLERLASYEIDKGVPDIVLAPTAYSVTHTNWVKDVQSPKGTRFLTMSNSSLPMFGQGGPFDVDPDVYARVEPETLEIADKLRQSTYVRVTGTDSDVVIHVDPDPKRIHAAIGKVSKQEPGEKGEIDNWLGAEAFAVPLDPREGGDSYGWFVTRKDWGGQEQFDYDVRFILKDGRFKRAEAVYWNNGWQRDERTEAKRWVDETLVPMIWGTENHDIVAELGMGTNPAVSAEYLLKNWSIAVGEKMRDYDGKRTVHIAHGKSSGMMKGINDVKMHQDFQILNVEKIDFDYTPPK